MSYATARLHRRAIRLPGTAGIGCRSVDVDGAAKNWPFGQGLTSLTMEILLRRPRLSGTSQVIFDAMGAYAILDDAGDTIKGYSNGMSGAAPVTSSTRIYDGEVHHLAASFTNGVLGYLHVDGVPQTPSASEMTVKADPTVARRVAVGIRYDAGAWPLTGDILAVRFCSPALYGAAGFIPPRVLGPRTDALILWLADHVNANGRIPNAMDSLLASGTGLYLDTTAAGVQIVDANYCPRSLPTIISIRSDDGRNDAAETSALAIADKLEAEGFRGTFALTTRYLDEGVRDLYPTAGSVDNLCIGWEDARDLAARGHEIAHHGINHIGIRGLPAGDISDTGAGTEFAVAAVGNDGTNDWIKVTGDATAKLAYGAVYTSIFQVKDAVSGSREKAAGNNGWYKVGATPTYDEPSGQTTIKIATDQTLGDLGDATGTVVCFTKYDELNGARTRFAAEELALPAGMIWPGGQANNATDGEASLAVGNSYGQVTSTSVTDPWDQHLSIPPPRGNRLHVLNCVTADTLDPGVVKGHICTAIEYGGILGLLFHDLAGGAGSWTVAEFEDLLAWLATLKAQGFLDVLPMGHVLAQAVAQPWLQEGVLPTAGDVRSGVAFDAGRKTGTLVSQGMLVI